MSSKPASEKICGVKKSYVEKFLTLLLNTYEKVDEAGFFLEERGNVANVVAMANMRDVLSHLVTLLQPGLTDSERGAQLAHAEEHLRRAMIEPYQIAINDLIRNSFKRTYDEYRQLILPIKDKDDAYKGAPSLPEIDGLVAEIADLVSTARKMKSRNRWDKVWEEGPKSLLEAFNKAQGIISTLEGFLNHYHSVGRGKKLVECQKRAQDLEHQLNNLSESAQDTIGSPQKTRAFVMFVDLVGSTWYLVNVQLENHADLFCDYMARINTKVWEYGGVLSKFTGDGALVYFTTSSDQERQQGRRAFACAMEIVNEGHKYFGTGGVRRILRDNDLPPPSVRVAVAEGTVHLVKLFGASDLIGRPVVAAQRLCSAKDFYGSSMEVLGTIDGVTVAGLRIGDEYEAHERTLTFPGSRDLDIAIIRRCVADPIRKLEDAD